MTIGLLASEEMALRRSPVSGFDDVADDTAGAREISAALRLRKLQAQQAERRRANGSDLPAPASILALFD